MRPPVRLIAAAVVLSLASLAIPAASSARARAVPHRRMVIGHSVRGRPIRATRVGPPHAPHVVLVVGVIHGNEGAGLAVCDRLLRMEPPPGVDVWVVKLMNPDGYHANTRQNARGVDLNRNFPWKWRRDGHRWSTYYTGPRAASEPETRIAMRLIRRIHPEITIWYHQHEDEVIKAGHHRIGIERRYARLVGMRFDRHYPWSSGRATNWENHRVRPSTAFVVELPAGRLSPASARRHARAVLAVARML